MVHRILTAVGMLMLFSSPLFAKIITVSQGGSADYSSIQAAINAAGPGDEVIIKDTSIYQEQVTIDSTKGGLTLRSENPLAAAKPAILFRDTVNIGPKSCAEAKDTSKITYDRNAALQILGAAGVRIEGIIVDGGGVYPFGYVGIWKEGTTDCRWPLQRGNAAITLRVAGEAIIRNCNIRNAYFGINVVDRNEGGIFANANPGDVYPENAVPLSGFALTGNHLIEHNRIHDNSFGLFFEAAWDLGSTVRYNLIYENHHPTSAIASKVKALTSDGPNQPGGAFMFIDDLLSPLAIYNNTFWHNMFIFVGGWNVSGVHLVFNNIFAEPYIYWGKESTFGGQSWQELSTVFTNRMYNCVFAAHQQKPDPNYVSIMNDMGQPKQEGDLIPKPFPASAEVRWLESHFLSTDTSSDLFLMPDWNSPLVQQCIVDKGWAASGVNDRDGTPADLGAISKSGGRPVDVVTVRPSHPMLYYGTEMDLNFIVTPRSGTIVDPRFLLFRFVRNLDTVSNFGNDCPEVDANNIKPLSFPLAAVAQGENRFNVPVASPGTYAFFELIIGGTGSDGKAVTSSVGFIPYRKFGRPIRVTVLDSIDGSPIDTVTAGVPVVLRLQALSPDSQLFTDTIKHVAVALSSGYDLLAPDGSGCTSIPAGIAGSVDLAAVFTRVPLRGTDIVDVTGIWDDDGTAVPFAGSSGKIKVLPTALDSVIFLNPPAGMTAPVLAARSYQISVAAVDRFGNKIQTLTAVKCECPVEYGTLEQAEVQTSSLGRASFRITVVACPANDSIPLVATLVASGKQSHAYLVCTPSTRIASFPSLSINGSTILCELIDLRGRVVKRFTAGSNLTTARTAASAAFARITGSGLYMFRLTDVTTGRVTMQRRIVLGR